MPPSTSVWVNAAPRATGQLRTRRNSGVVPWMEVFQLASSDITCEPARSTGAASRTAESSVWMAFRSSQVSEGSEPAPPMAPPPCEEPLRTMSMLEPMAAKVCSTRALAPSPMATMAMTAATPMTTPSPVRKERSLLRARARSATRSVMIQLTGAPPGRPAPPRSAGPGAGRSGPARHAW